MTRFRGDPLRVNHPEPWRLTTANKTNMKPANTPESIKECENEEEEEEFINEQARLADILQDDLKYPDL